MKKNSNKDANDGVALGIRPGVDFWTYDRQSGVRTSGGNCRGWFNENEEIERTSFDEQRRTMMGGKNDVLH